MFHTDPLARKPIFNFKISGLYHRDTENTEVWKNDAKHFMMLLRELRVLCVSVVKLLGTNFLFRISGLEDGSVRKRRMPILPERAGSAGEFR
jgi:hypothetical protein